MIPMYFSSRMPFIAITVRAWKAVCDHSDSFFVSCIGKLAKSGYPRVPWKTIVILKQKPTAKKTLKVVNIKLFSLSAILGNQHLLHQEAGFQGFWLLKSVSMATFCGHSFFSSHTSIPVPDDLIAKVKLLYGQWNNKQKSPGDILSKHWVTDPLEIGFALCSWVRDTINIQQCPWSSEKNIFSWKLLAQSFCLISSVVDYIQFCCCISSCGFTNRN